MEQAIPLTAAERYASAVSEATLSRGHSTEADGSGISWGAVIAGAFVAAALSLALLALGTGLGLSSVSPWSNTGASATTISAVAIAWLILMSVISSGMGGYLAGRLRTRWTHVHTDEVYFRDTAHGFLAWAVALVVTAAFLASASASMMGPPHPQPPLPPALLDRNERPLVPMDTSWIRCSDPRMGGLLQVIPQCQGKQHRFSPTL